jgi:hypothetical protein
LHPDALEQSFSQFQHPRPEAAAGRMDQCLLQNIARFAEQQDWVSAIGRCGTGRCADLEWLGCPANVVHLAQDNHRAPYLGGFFRQTGLDISIVIGTIKR